MIIIILNRKTRYVVLEVPCYNRILGFFLLVLEWNRVLNKIPCYSWGLPVLNNINQEYFVELMKIIPSSPFKHLPPDTTAGTSLLLRTSLWFTVFPEITMKLWNKFPLLVFIWHWRWHFQWVAMVIFNRPQRYLTQLGIKKPKAPNVIIYLTTTHSIRSQLHTWSKKTTRGVS